MPTTMQLLNRALASQKQARWAELLDVSDATLSVAKRRGRLSPTLAGEIAQALGEDPRDWIAIAALEAEPDTEHRRKLMTRIGSTIRNLYFKNGGRRVHAAARRLATAVTARR